jgi:isoquinoline 1-oxidoreductase subunit beta
MTMASIAKIARRTFLIGAATIAGGLAVGYYYVRKPKENPLEKLVEGEWRTFNPYVMIEPTGKIVLIAPRAEMGQGIATTLAALVAEELEVSLDQVEVQHGPASGAYYNSGLAGEAVPFASFEHGTMAQTMRAIMGSVTKLASLQVTGGSSSIVDGYEKMRVAGATAREMLKAAAAARLGVVADTLKAENGEIFDPASGTRITYGDLVLDAAKLAPPDNVKLKDRKEWKLLGKPQKRVDMRAKVTGAAIYGVDLRLPGMVYGTVKMNPNLTGKMKSFDAAEALKIPGVVKVFEIKCQSGEGIGIIADNTWTAFKAADAVKVEWDKAPYPQDSAAMFKLLDEALKPGTGSSLRTLGDVDTAFADAPAGKVVEAKYQVPFLAHATMEPMNATAQFKNGKLTLWSPNQAPTAVRYVCARIAGVEQENVIVNTPMMGGGFGRRGEMDFSIYATLIAMQAEGRPVKVIWSREEDMTHDTYRPAAMAHFKARLNDEGLPVALDGMIAVPSIMRSMIGRTLPSMAGMPLGPDKGLTDGAFNQPYDIADFRMSGIDVELPVPIGFWRSVGNSHNGFFHESFMDEVAIAGKIDPLALRLKLMQPWPAAVKLVEKVGQMSNWGKAAPGRTQGFAFTLAFGGWVAQVIEISQTPDGIKLEKIWVATDVGTVLDPENLKAQIVSGLVYGLSAAMSEEITFADGVVQQSNFHDFDAMRIWQCPEIAIEILENSEEMGGAGEISTPGAAPALANAIFALNGKRIRTLPLSREVTFA